MGRGIRIAVVMVAAVAILSIGAFLYLTRGIAAPSVAIQDSVTQLDAAGTSGSETMYRISQDDSAAEYNIFEVLNGSDKTVVGTTNQVAGDILINLSDPASRRLATSALMPAPSQPTIPGAIIRWRASSCNRKTMRMNSSPSRRPASAACRARASAWATASNFTVTGDLTIAGTTKIATFTVTATLESADKLVGHAETTVLRSDYNLTIPSVPFVANVGDEVTLKLDFVAAQIVADATL